MKTSFSVKVTIELNEDGGGGGAAAAEANDGGNPIVDLFLAQCLKKMINDATKKYVRDKGTTIEEAEEAKDVYSPLPQRRIPSDADDEERIPSDADESVDDDDDDDASTVDPDASNDDEEEDEVGDLPNVEINVEIDNEYEEDYQLSQKMSLMRLRRRD